MLNMKNETHKVTLTKNHRVVYGSMHRILNFIVIILFKIIHNEFGG